MEGELRAEVAAGDKAEKLATGLTAVLAGPANAGKSSLLNSLCEFPPPEPASPSPFPPADSAKEGGK